MSSKIFQYSAFTSAWARLGHLGEDVPRPVDQTSLAQALRQHDLARPDQPRCTVGDDEQRRGEATADEVGEEPGPGVMALGLPWGEPDQHRRTFGGDAPGAQHRLGRGSRVELEVRSVEEQVVEVRRSEDHGSARPRTRP